MLCRVTEIEGKDEREEGEDEVATSTEAQQLKGVEVVVEREEEEREEEVEGDGSEIGEVRVEKERSGKVKDSSTKDIIQVRISKLGHAPKINHRPPQAQAVQPQ